METMECCIELCVNQYQERKSEANDRSLDFNLPQGFLIKKILSSPCEWSDLIYDFLCTTVAMTEFHHLIVLNTAVS